MKPLHIDSSILGANSVSRGLSAEIVAHQQKLHSGLEVMVSACMGLSLSTVFLRFLRRALFAVDASATSGTRSSSVPAEAAGWLGAL